MPEQEAQAVYEQILRSYLESSEESYLYQAAQLGRRLLQQEVPPEVVVEMHAQVVESVTRGFPPAEQLEGVKQAYTPLMEVVMAYGLAFRWHEQLQREIAERVRAEEALLQHNRELELLNRASQAFSSTLDLDQILVTVLEEVRHLLDVIACSVWLIDPKTTELVCQQAIGLQGEIVQGWRLAPGQGLGGWVVRHDESLIVPDAQSDEHHFKEVDEQTGLPLRSILTVPLRGKRGVIGVIQVVDLEAGLFGSTDLTLLELVAAGAVGAIENARLYEQAQQEITERVRAEEALQAERASLARRVAERTADLSAVNAELARASRLKDEFLANMSHELRTPLNAILGMSEALQEQVYGTLNARQLKCLHTVEESGHHLLSLINDILDVSKIEAGKLELELRPVSVESVCQASLAFIKQTANNKQLKISFSLDGGSMTLHADERHLKQILVNLLANAVKFTPEGGEIGLEVVGDVGEEAVHFTVWDTGIGVLAEDMERLFQPFVQLDSSLSRQHAGTGLGLALVHRLAELHGGGVSAESEAGKGSRFTVSLPWREPFLSDGDGSEGQPVEAGKPAVSEMPGIPAARRVLVIEDSTTAADQLARYLNELGAETVIHPRGEGAVDRALALQPDVIILDILLPDLPGWDVLTQLKTEPRTQDIPILIVSVVDDRSRGLALGAAEYLVKPISRPQFRQALRRILHQEKDKLKALVVKPARTETHDEQFLVLLAEDNESNINTVSDYLLTKGYRVVVARNGAEAIETARVERPDLILMDVQMPGMDGLEATRRIRADADRSIASVPIIALTALAMPGDRERCLAAGANEYLSKPVGLKHLVNLIEAQLRADVKA